MKEWIMKHPILTFLLVDGVITGLFNTIRTFAPSRTEVTVEPEIEIETDEEERK